MQQQSRLKVRRCPFAVTSKTCRLGRTYFDQLNYSIPDMNQLAAILILAKAVSCRDKCRVA